MDKTYTKEEVRELIHEYESSKCRYSGETDIWLKVRGFIDEPTNNTTHKPKQYSVKDEIERKEREVEDNYLKAHDNTPSLDKVMKAIDRVEDNIRATKSRANSRDVITSNKLYSIEKDIATLIADKIVRDMKWYQWWG